MNIGRFKGSKNQKARKSSENGDNNRSDTFAICEFEAFAFMNSELGFTKKRSYNLLRL